MDSFGHLSINHIARLGRLYDKCPGPPSSKQIKMFKSNNLQWKESPRLGLGSDFSDTPISEAFPVRVWHKSEIWRLRFFKQISKNEEKVVTMVVSFDNSISFVGYGSNFNESACFPSLNKK